MLNFFSRKKEGPPPLGPPPPHLQTKVTVLGKNEIYRWENLATPFLAQTFASQSPPPRPPPPVKHSPG